MGFVLYALFLDLVAKNSMAEVVILTSSSNFFLFFFFFHSFRFSWLFYRCFRLREND